MSGNCIKQLVDAFDGSVFIYASGVSSKEFPLNEYRDEKFVVVNGAVVEFLRLGVMPFAYVFDDNSFLENNVNLVLRAVASSRMVFMPYHLYCRFDLADSLSEDDKAKIYFVDKVNRENGLKIQPYKAFYLKNLFNQSMVFKRSRMFFSSRNLGFSKDLRLGYFCARTIPYVALQLAYYLGFNKVFFIGVDLNASVGRFYDTNNPLPTSLDQDYERYILPSFKIVSKYVVSENFRIYNLSVKSRLPHKIIPKVTLRNLRGFING